jgi:putative DNA primase/helicase
MQVDVEQSVELAGDRAEDAAQRVYTDGCFVPSSPCGDKPYLIVDNSDLPATAHELRDVLARSGDLFDRDGPVQVVPSREGGPPIARRMTPSRVVREAHRLSRPVKLVGEELVPVALPNSVARMYLEMDGEWDLRPLAGICTAPVLSSDGSIRTAEGYDQDTGLWCANVPDLKIPEHPTRDDAAAALRLIRRTFRTFPFADAARRHEAELGVEVVDLDHPPGIDESTFLVGLLTAVCRPSLWLVPGLLVRVPARGWPCVRSARSPSVSGRVPSRRAATATNWTND